MLSIADFYIGKEGGKSQLLFRGSADPTVLLIKSKESRSFDATFDKLSSDRHLQDLEFLVYDISHRDNRKLVAMASTTNTPIMSIPMVLIYVDGKARAKIKPADYRTLVANIQNAMSLIIAEDERVRAEEARLAAEASSRRRRSTASSGGSRGGRTSEPPNVRKNSFIPQPEEEEDDTLMIPDSIIPHNLPWLSADE